MNRRSFRALIVLNVVLLAALLITSTATEPAQAQGFGGGNYIMIAGQVQGLPQEAVYIVDLNAGLMVTVAVNASNKKFRVLGGRDLQNDMERAGNIR